jgi:hypothetical protein
MRLTSFKPRRLILSGAGSLVFFGSPGLADDPHPDPLAEQFQDPPQSARPRVWWHWLNGNISKDGIAKDIAWMKEVGIGGIQTFDTSLAATQVVNKPLRYMTPEWKDAFHLAASLAADNDLEFGIATSPGFSETGGPWVAAADAMKKVVWSDITLPGRKRFVGKLPQPPSTPGPFQSITSPEADALARAGRALDPFYHDIVLLAYPASRRAASDQDPVSFTSLKGQAINRSVLSDGLYKEGVRIETGTAEDPGGLRVSFAAPQTIRSATMFITGKSALFDIPLAPRLEASLDGATWVAIADVPIAAVPTTVSFTPMEAREFRLVLLPGRSLAMNQNAPADGAVGAELLTAGPPRGPKTVNLAEFTVSSAAKVDRFETKAAFTTSKDYYALNRDKLPNAAGIDPGRIIDLTDRLAADGSLDWTPPAGRWRVVRLGYSLTGAINHPASPEATGLEVDKFDAAAVRRYMEHYLDLYREAAGPELFGARGVSALLNDSIESGDANWTSGMIAQFKRLRGYDPTLWLPALTGEIVVSRRKTDAFLYDYRRTVAELIADQHYATIAAVAHENGLRSYMESLEGGRSQIGDDMAMRAKADVPMAAMWAFTADRGPKPGYVADIKGAASLAHFFGQNVVAAESFTSLLRPWADAPRDLKPTIDLELVTGVNLPAIHTSVHQPVEGKPGLPFHIIGQYFNRMDSWAPMARPWIDYIARSSFLLQQGRNVADVAYFYGEEAPLAGLFGDALVGDVPAQWAYDFINADMLAQLQVKDGRLLAPGGASYKVLYLGGSSARMTLATLKRLDQLSEAGAAIVGDPPASSPALRDDPAEFNGLVAKMWGNAGNPAGKGILPGGSIQAAMQALGQTPDFAFSGGSGESRIPFVHRRITDGDIYFLANLREHPDTIQGRFRVTGKAPELWVAETGVRTPLPYRIEGDHTVVPLTLAGGDAKFVVFRREADKTAMTIAPAAPTPLARIEGSWTVAFQAGRGAPPTAKLTELASLADHGDPAIRYFSGIATYTRKFALPKTLKPGEPLLLDLGVVGDLAEVRVNGKLVGAPWHSPFQVEIGRATKAGANTLEVRVAHLWVNRLIGDARKEGLQITSTSRPVYKPATPLRPSGLIGPVQLLSSPLHPQ